MFPACSRALRASYPTYYCVSRVTCPTRYRGQVPRGLRAFLHYVLCILRASCFACSRAICVSLASRELLGRIYYS